MGRMDRRGFLIAAAAFAGGAAPPQGAGGQFADGRSVFIGGREFALADAIAPAMSPPAGKPEPAAPVAAAVLERVLGGGERIAGGGERTDRWGRVVGPVGWRRATGETTTLEELLLAEGAARVAPQSDDFGFIARCYAAEDGAREKRLGLWREDAWRVRDAARAEWSEGYQVYRGVIRSASERGGRVFFNFGEDFRRDFTATAARGAFRRWKNRTPLEAYAGASVEARGLVLRINGPSIELKHELQMRVLSPASASAG